MQSWRLQINLNQGCTTTYVTVVYLAPIVKNRATPALVGTFQLNWESLLYQGRIGFVVATARYELFSLRFAS